MPSGVYKRTEEMRKNIGKAAKGRVPWNKGKKMHFEVWNKGGAEYSDETREKMRLGKLGKRGEKTNNWKGGSIGWIHKRSRELYSKDRCEICGITNDEHKRRTKMSLGIHSRSKEYDLENENNWVTVCLFGCHQKIEKIDGGKKDSTIKWR